MLRSRRRLQEEDHKVHYTVCSRWFTEWSQNLWRFQVLVNVTWALIHKTITTLIQYHWEQSSSQRRIFPTWSTCSEPTLWHVDSEGASGNLLPSKGHVDGVRSLQNGNIGAPENTVAFVLQDNLHCIPPTVWIHNDDAYISSTRPWWTDRQTTGLSNTDRRIWLSLEQIQTEQFNWDGSQVRVDVP